MALIKVGPSGEPIPTPSFCLYKTSLNNKFNKLLKVSQPGQDPQKVIFNYSNISLSGAEKSLVVKGLKFSIPSKKLNYADYLANFELFSRSI